MAPSTISPPGTLPAWGTVLVVVAHPDDESFGLGAVIDALARAGSAVHVLCLTQGEASTLGAAPDLAAIRAAELQHAARELGARSTELLDLPDGGLADLDLETLQAPVRKAVASVTPDGLLVMDSTGISGHPDHIAATNAAVAVARQHDLPVLAWTIPDEIAARLLEETGVPFVGRGSVETMTIEVDRANQRRAIDAHASQAVPGSVLWRRLELQGGVETLTWLRPVTQEHPR
ncbi:PIG-L deacetylase family protein [Ornithinimicrobium panacihumi]|uniref:PIG-L deacetylase family protein n=1 Tax=Ornithinimicrobium panacihumi TaxID=2008449 RepID=UPI003F8A2860